MKKELNSAEEALVFIADLIEEQKWLILPATEENGKFVVEYIEHKTYTALDGKEYPDELWITEAGVPLLVQEMSEAHVRNTLRMLLRNQRMIEQGLANLAEMFGSLSDGEADAEPSLEDMPDDSGNEADNEIVRQLKSVLSGNEHPDMQIPATAVKGPTTLQ